MISQISETIVVRLSSWRTINNMEDIVLSYWSTCKVFIYLNQPLPWPSSLEKNNLLVLVFRLRNDLRVHLANTRGWELVAKKQSAGRQREMLKADERKTVEPRGLQGKCTRQCVMNIQQLRSLSLNPLAGRHQRGSDTDTCTLRPRPRHHRQMATKTSCGGIREEEWVSGGGGHGGGWNLDDYFRRSLYFQTSQL